MLECLELNSILGTFVGPLKPRVDALAVIEAVDREGVPCNVRLIGRILSKVPRPYPLIRIKWVRALSPLLPDEFVETMIGSYGFLPDVNVDHLELGLFYLGTEYDFVRRLVFPRRPDSARGDGAEKRRVETPVAGIPRFRADETGEVRHRVGMDTTQAGTSSKKAGD